MIRFRVVLPQAVKVVKLNGSYGGAGDSTDKSVKRWSTSWNKPYKNGQCQNLHGFA